jgi:hypothetical protein
VNQFATYLISMPTIAYRTSVSAAVTGETEDGFAREVDRILADPRGWRKYGYTFMRDLSAQALHIRLETSANANALCHARGFSCARLPYNEIVIHEGNWMGGSKSRLPLERYRNYCICHEAGHILGLEHQFCPIAECKRRGMRECPASVMQQHTRGPAHISPCVENDWPLDPDWGVDDPRAPSKTAAPLVVLILLVVLVIAAAGTARLWTAWGARAGRRAGRYQVTTGAPGPSE